MKMIMDGMNGGWLFFSPRTHQPLLPRRKYANKTNKHSSSSSFSLSLPLLDTMVAVKESPSHNARRVAIRKLRRQFLNLGRIDEFLPADLEKLKIRAQPMTFDRNGNPDFKPCFFAQYPEEIVPETKNSWPKYEEYSSDPD